MSDLEPTPKKEKVEQIPYQHREAEILDFQDTINLLGPKEARIAMKGLKITDRATDSYGIISCTIKTVDLQDVRFKDAKKYKSSVVDGKIKFEPVLESFL